MKRVLPGSYRVPDGIEEDDVQQTLIDLQNARQLEGGARRTWREVAAALQVRESQALGYRVPRSCGQAIRDQHDRALDKIRKAMGDAQMTDIGDILNDMARAA